MRLRPYKSYDSRKIAGWIKNEETFLNWGGDRFGSYPITAEVIDDKYRNHNGDCEEEDNFYPWTAFTDEDGVVGHFIMRYLHGDNKILRFGWVIVDDTVRGKDVGTEMLLAGLEVAFQILGVHTVTIGVFENNEIAHRCYQKAGFVDRKIVRQERGNIMEMSISKDDYLKRVESLPA